MSQISQMKWEADKMLDVYIHDYLVKRQLNDSAKAFKAEGKVSSDPLAIDAPGGFLFEWWSVFWDIFIAKTNGKTSGLAASYIETQMRKAREQQQKQQHKQQQQQQHQHQRQHQHQHQHQHQQQQQQQLQMQQLLLQRHAHHQQQQQQQQQQHDGAHLFNDIPNGIVSNDHLMRHNPGANAMAAKLYEERLKVNDAAMKQRFGDNVGQMLDQNHASILKSAGVNSQPSGQLLHGAAGGMTSQIQTQSQQQPGSTADIKSEINPVLNNRAAGSEGSLIGIQGSNQGDNNLTLKGWPLTGFDHLRTGHLQQQTPYIQAPQPTFNQHQLLTLRHQQQLLLAQQNLTSPSTSDESRRLRMLMNTRNMGLGKDGLPNSVMDVPIAGPPSQTNGPHMPRGDTDMLIKIKFAQQQQQQNGTNSQKPHHHQHYLSNQHSQSLNNLHQQDKMGAAGNVIADGSMSNSFGGNDQKVSKNPTPRKRKQPVSSSGPANSSGTANAAGPSPGSAPSTPSTHTPGDTISMPLAHNSNSSKPMMMFGTDGTGTLTSPSNQLAAMDHFVDDGSLDNVESFLSPDNADQRDAVGHCMNVSKDHLHSPQWDDLSFLDSIYPDVNPF